MMNERIRDLAEQAGAIEVKDITNIPKALSLNGEEIEKFAQLIVGECAEVLDKTIAPPSHPMNSIGWKLKQHFGVKE